jgi:excisionase family DNA binding protein
MKGTVMHTPPLSQKILLDIREVTALTGICRDAIYAAIASGDLKARKRGKSTLIRQADLHNWVDALPHYLPAVDSKAAPAAPAPAPAVRKRRLTPRLQAAE